VSNSLYIFVTSEIPDPYLNSVAHCLIYEGVRRVVFVYIKGLEGQNPQSYQSQDSISSVVSRNMQILMSELATSGEYRHFVGKDKGKRVELKDFYSQDRVLSIQGFYRQCLDMRVRWEDKDINYSNLRKEMARINKGDPGSIFDITAIKKLFLGDIIAASIIEGVHKLYTFDLKTKPNFDEPWKMLIHDLLADNTSGRKYDHVNIVDTPVFDECANSILVRTLPLKMSLVVASLFLIAALVVYFIYGEVNWFIQITSVTSAVAGLLSLYL